MHLTGSRTNILFFGAVALILVGLTIGYFIYSTTPERKPVEFQEKPYEYYVIIDEDSGKTLAIVATAVVSVGDEYLNEDGQWYEVVRVAENRAYARRFEKKR